MLNKFAIVAVLVAAICFGGVHAINAQGDTREKATSGAGWQWPASTDGITYIPVCWENPAGYASEEGLVREKVLNTWAAVANVNFYGWAACSQASKGIRILITDTRSNSRVGKSMNGVKNAMELNFTFKNFEPSCQAANRRPYCITSIAVHEFGHALGLMHEQDRADSTCTTEKTGNGGWLLTAYDPNSVMNYCNPRWNNDGNLSPLDVKGIQILYGARSLPKNGRIAVTDVLNTAAGQKWEHIIMQIGGPASRRDFVLQDTITKQTNTWSYPDGGKYCYKIWSNSLYTSGVYRDGYGEGCYTLEPGKSYSWAIAFKKGTGKAFFNIVLEAARK